MQINLNKLLTTDILEINDNFIIPESYLKNSLINKLNDTNLRGEIILNEDDDLILTGNISGNMTLNDDITLELVDYNFQTEIEENLGKFENNIDITDILWQNISVEIPSKVRKTNEDINLSGNGWRVISEETFIKERQQLNNPFKDLNQIIETKEDK